MRDDERISAHLDGELDELQSHRLARELDRDPELREALDTLRDNRDRLRALADASNRAPAGFSDRVMAGLDTQEGPQAPTLSWRPFALAAAAALVLYAALPGHGLVADPAAAPPARAPVSTDASYYAVLASQAYTLQPAALASRGEGLPDSLADLRHAVEAVGGTLEGAGPGYTLVVPTARWADAQEAVGKVGALTPVGAQVPFLGQVRVTVSIVP
jgi:hypothetical protein